MARSFNDEITYTCCFLAQALECVRQQTHNPLRKMSDALRDAWLNGRADRLGAKGEALAWALRKAWYAQGMGWVDAGPQSPGCLVLQEARVDRYLQQNPTAERAEGQRTSVGALGYER